MLQSGKIGRVIDQPAHDRRARSAVAIQRRPGHRRRVQRPHGPHAGQDILRGKPDHLVPAGIDQLDPSLARARSEGFGTPIRFPCAVSHTAPGEKTLLSGPRPSPSRSAGTPPRPRPCPDTRAAQSYGNGAAFPRARCAAACCRAGNSGSAGEPATPPADTCARSDRALPARVRAWSRNPCFPPGESWPARSLSAPGPSFRARDAGLHGRHRTARHRT